jgi:hypothetical protein
LGDLIVCVAQVPRIIEAEPSVLWKMLSGVPEGFTMFALSRYGRRFAAVWCRDVRTAEPRAWWPLRSSVAWSSAGQLSAPVLIAASDEKKGEVLSLSEGEVLTCLAFAARWSTISVAPTECSSGTILRPHDRLRVSPSATSKATRTSSPSSRKNLDSKRLLKSSTVQMSGSAGTARVWAYQIDAPGPLR